MNEQDEEVPVSGTDPLNSERDDKREEVRRLGDYSPTNTPLSAAEVRQREALCDKEGDDCEWPRGSANSLHDVVPVEDQNPLPER